MAAIALTVQFHESEWVILTAFSLNFLFVDHTCCSTWGVKIHSPTHITHTHTLFFSIFLDPFNPVAMHMLWLDWSSNLAQLLASYQPYQLLPIALKSMSELISSQQGYICARVAAAWSYLSLNPPFPVTRVRCDVDEVLLWPWRGVLTHSAGPRAPEWDLAQDDKGTERKSKLELG